MVGLIQPTDTPESTIAAQTSPKSVAGMLLDRLGSVWLGVFWAVLLFVYCSIGSAMPSVRQHPMLEMTEFEWFHWWPFNVLMALLCTTLVIATIRQIPLRLVNGGVWAIHSGIILLCIGSYYYFGTKVEGDAPVFRRHVRIEMAGMDGPQTLVALPGNRISVLVGRDLWHFSIQSTNSAWPILSKKHQGEKAYAVNVRVTPPAGDPFIRQLLAGYPQYTEDIIPGQGRAIKSIGRKLVNLDLKLSLAYEPQEYFHVMQSWALFVRPVGEVEWSQRLIEGLPRYNDRIGARDQVFTDPHESIPLRSIDLEVHAAPDGDALGPASVRITGYLRYAHMQRRWRDGGTRLNPVLRVSTLSDDARPQSYDLVALDGRHSQSDDGMVEFRWLNDSSMISELQTDPRAMLHIVVPDANVKLDVPITPDNLVGHDGPFTDLEGTGFAYRILNVQDKLVIPGKARVVSVAMVEIKTPEDQFTRMVADRPEMTRDMKGGTADPHTPAGRTPEKADPRIQMTYQPRSAPIIYAAHPGGLHLIANSPSGRLVARDVKVGELVEVVPGVSFRADALWTHAVTEVKPAIVPPAARERNMGESFSMIRLEVNSGHEVQAKWLRFNQHVLPNEQYAYSGRFLYTPERFRLADGSSVEVIFSRQRRRLPNPIALDAFALDTHIGGFTGQALTIRNYVSKLSFFDNGEWTEATPISVNAPTEYGGYWYFQSTWDKPPSGSPTGGMNYTGLGVGNRNGVYVQLAGCCIAVAGMLFAFYVKPIVKRRQYEQSKVGLSGTRDQHGERPAAVPAPEAVEV